MHRIMSFGLLGAGLFFCGRGPAAERAFLEVIDDPAEVRAAVALAEGDRPKPLSVEVLVHTYVLSPDLVPAGMARDEAMARLRRIVEEEDLLLNARDNAACLMAMIDPVQGQATILELLETSDAEGKRSLLVTLMLLHEELLRIDHPPLIAALKSLAADPALGGLALRTCANRDVPGFEVLLWKLLENAKGEHRHEILSRLARVAPDRKVYDLCVEAVEQAPIDKCYEPLRTVSRFFDVEDDNLGPEAIAFTAGQLLELIDKGVTGTGDFPQHVCTDVLEKGTEPQARALAEAVLATFPAEHMKRRAYIAMRRWEDQEAARNRVLADLNHDERYKFAIAAVQERYDKTGDEPIVNALVEQIGKRPEEPDRILLANALIDVGGGWAIAAARKSIAQLPEQARNELLTRLERKPPGQLVRQLADAGLIEVDDVDKHAAEIVKTFVDGWGEEYYEDNGLRAEDVLQAGGLALTFDAETGFIPVEHHKLIDEFAAASSGAFQPTAGHELMLRKNDDDWEAPYRVQFVHGGKLYRFTARNFGDWYDIERVVIACNRALADAGSPRRFFQIDNDGQAASFICVTPDKAKILAEEFHVTFTDDAAKAMREGKAFEQEVIRSLEQKQK